MIRTTAGQFLINEALPEPLRDYNRVLDKKGMQALLRDVAQKHPEQYREVSKKLADIGRETSTRTGGNSFGLAHMKKSAAGRAVQQKLQAKVQRILDAETWPTVKDGVKFDTPMTEQMRNDLIVRAAGDEMEPQQEAVFKEALAAKNPLAVQLIGAGRGNKMNLSSLLGSDLLYSDQRDNAIPLPVLRSYSQGLTPAEYWAGTYGARRGVMATKFATQDAGFLSKQLNQVSHRLVVEADDEDDQPEVDENGKPIPRVARGVPMDTDDMDNEGALLAADVTDKDGNVLYKRNTVLSPKILKNLTAQGKKRILVRSPMVGGTPNGGVYARDVGVREKGVIPGRGEMVGLTAAQALSEPISQGQLSAKHSGGVTGQEKAVSGFQAIDQQIQVPKTFKGGAAHTEEDGVVERVEAAPQGGHYVFVNGKEHYVPRGAKPSVKRGDTVEAGDVISDGAPNPAIITQHKGVGEGRRYFVKSFRDALGTAGVKGHRRNVELLSRGLINHVRLTAETGDHVPDDVVPYSTLEKTWKPRDGHTVSPLKAAVGQYLERPVLHYTIGTKIRPSMLRDLEEFGVKDVAVHKDPPPFQSEMIRGMNNLRHDPDPFTRMYGSGLKASLLDATHRGAVSDELGTSFVPGLARAVDFGRQGVVRQPAAGTVPPPEGQPLPKVTRGVQEFKPFKPAPAPAPLPVAKPPEQPKSPSRWGSLFKISTDAARTRELIKQAQNPAVPAAPAAPVGGGMTPSTTLKPPAPAGGNPLTPGGGPGGAPGGVAPLTGTTAATPAGSATTAGIAAKAQQSNNQPLNPLQGAAVNNPFALSSGYQGGTNAVTDQTSAQAFSQGDVTGLDPHGMATLMGWNSMGGYTKNPSAYQIDRPQPQGYGPGGRGGMPGMGGFGGDFGFIGGEGGGQPGGDPQAAGPSRFDRAMAWMGDKDGRRVNLATDSLNAAFSYNPVGVVINAGVDGYDVYDKARKGYEQGGWQGAEQAVHQRGLDKAQTTNDYLARPFQAKSVGEGLEEAAYTLGHVVAKPLHVVDNVNTIVSGSNKLNTEVGEAIHDWKMVGRGQDDTDRMEWVGLQRRIDQYNKNPTGSGFKPEDIQAAQARIAELAKKHPDHNMNKRNVAAEVRKELDRLKQVDYDKWSKSPEGQAHWKAKADADNKAWMIKNYPDQVPGTPEYAAKQEFERKREENYKLSKLRDQPIIGASNTRLPRADATGRDYTLPELEAMEAEKVKKFHAVNDQTPLAPEEVAKYKALGYAPGQPSFEALRETAAKDMIEFHPTPELFQIHDELDKIFLLPPEEQAKAFGSAEEAKKLQELSKRERTRWAAAKAGKATDDDVYGYMRRNPTAFGGGQAPVAPGEPAKQNQFFGVPTGALPGTAVEAVGKHYSNTKEALTTAVVSPAVVAKFEAAGLKPGTPAFEAARAEAVKAYEPYQDDFTFGVKHWGDLIPHMEQNKTLKPEDLVQLKALHADNVARVEAAKVGKVPDADVYRYLQYKQSTRPQPAPQPAPPPLVKGGSLLTDPGLVRFLFRR